MYLTGAWKLLYGSTFCTYEAANADSCSCPCSFVRIPSTWCEQQRFDLILANLDSSFLLQLALGHWFDSGIAAHLRLVTFPVEADDGRCM